MSSQNGSGVMEESSEPVLPGRVVPLELSSNQLAPGHRIKEFRLGAGVEVQQQQDQADDDGAEAGQGVNSAVVTVAGTLLRRTKDNSTCHIWYSPSTGDQVVGIIEDKTGDFYRVNIRSGAACNLSRIAFEGATKRNKPELRVGEAVYCRVQQAHADLDTELTCISASASTKKEWSSGEAVFGPLPQGLLVQVSLNFARYLLQQENALLSALAKHFPFEVAVGANGLVWMRAASSADAVVLRSALLEADVRAFDDVQVQALADVLARKHRQIDVSEHK